MDCRSVLRALLCALLVAPTPSCLAYFTDPEEETVPVFAGAVSPNQAAFVALRAAVDDRADEMARRIVGMLRGRRLSAPEGDLLDSYERILAGRAILQGLDLELVPLEREDSTDLVLRLQAVDGPFTLHVPPATLEHHRVAVDPRGLETRERATQLRDVLDGVEVPGNGVLELELGSFDRRIGGALAVRDSWRLRLVSGEVLHASGTFPARGWNEPSCELITRSPSLDPEPVSPAVVAGRFAELLEDEPPPGADLLTLCIRLESGQRGEALRAIHAALDASPVALPGPLPSDGPAQRVLPALRWLARTNEPGVELATWTRWLGIWIRRDDQRARAQSGAAGLDLGNGNLRWAADEQERGRRAEAPRRGLDLP